MNDKRNDFEVFWEDKKDFLNVDKETAEIIWNSAVVSTIHSMLNFTLQADSAK